VGGAVSAGARPTLELVPLTVTSMARDLLTESASWWCSRRPPRPPERAPAESLGLDEAASARSRASRRFRSPQRRIEYARRRPREATAAAGAGAVRGGPAILAEHPREKGLIHAPSYAAGGGSSPI